jgi:hypothetical protein
MNFTNTSADAQHSNRTLGRRSFLQEAGALAGAGAITALAGCSSAGAGGGTNGDGEGGSTPTPKPDEPVFPLTASVSEPYHFYRRVLEYEDNTEYHGPVWLVDLTFDLAVDVDDWKSTDEYVVPSRFPIRVSEDGGNPEYARIFHINEDEGWYRVEDKWFVERSHFVVDGTETEYLVLGYGEDNEPEVGTDYSVYLEDRTNQDFHELVSFSYDGNPTEHDLLAEYRD